MPLPRVCVAATCKQIRRGNAQIDASRQRSRGRDAELLCAVIGRFQRLLSSGSGSRRWLDTYSMQASALGSDDSSMDRENPAAKTIQINPGSKHAAWLAAQLPFTVRETIKLTFGIMRHLPHQQALVAVSDGGKVVACNEALLGLLGRHDSEEVLDRRWSEFMPGYVDHLPHSGVDPAPFDEQLVRSEGQPLAVHISVSPVREEREQRAVANVLFVTPCKEGDDDETTRLPQHETSSLTDPRLAAVAACLDVFGDDRNENLRNLAQVVSDLAGAQYTTLRVPRGDGYVIVAGWRLEQE